MASIVRLGDRILPDRLRQVLGDVGLLFLRASFGLTLALVHGWDKLTTFGEKAGGFPDPLGVGNAFSLGLVTFAELFCGLALALGLFTRLAAIPPIISMSVALTMIHVQDPWQKKELAFVYFLALVAIALAGAGRYSLDALLRGVIERRSGPPEV